jgi:hypothetical protein
MGRRVMKLPRAALRTAQMMTRSAFRKLARRLMCAAAKKKRE